MENFAQSRIKKYSGFLFFVTTFILPAIFIMSLTELSFDEAYYWIYSENLNLGYFDHPPVVALIIKLGTSVFGKSEFGVRFGGFLFFIASICLMLKTLNTNLKNHTFWLLLLSFPLINLTPLFALPDIGILFFCCLYFYALKQFYKNETIGTTFLLSVAIVGMFYSKYHGLLVVILTVISNLTLLKRKSFYIVVSLVLLFYLPHIWWQYKHDFVSFKFHMFGRSEKHFDISNIINFLLGQFVLMGGPILIYVLLKFKKFQNKEDPFNRALIYTSLGFLVCLFFLSFRNQIEANWSITCAISLMLLVFPHFKSNSRLIIKLGLLTIFLSIFFKGIILFIPHLSKIDLKDNRFNEIYGWKDKRIPELLDYCENKTLVGDNYQVTAKVAFYTNDKSIPALHLGSRSSQYEILNLENKLKPDEEICYFTSKALEGTKKIETGYKDPVYVLKNIKLKELLNFYKVSYEEIIRSRF